MGFPSEVNLFNTILVSQPIGIQALMNTVVRLEGTLWGAGSWDNGVDTAGSGVTEIGLHNYYLEPGFVDPDDGNYHLQSSSPAIDRGVPVDTAVDMDNETRPMGAAPDLGADEVPADPTNPITWSPVALNPQDGATDQPTTLMLRWQTDSLRSDQAVYTVHLGTENPPQANAEIGETRYAASLEANRTYYWSITIFDGTNSLPGPVWYFTTTKSVSPSLPEQNQL
jgi:hypothetical protein